ncbi:hypothetical protein [Acuticoccus sp.]|uniref:hypothetical protein n=1 Tax=Acuticoccus sp. TaxID=1904378 RepID=UPI003B525FB3
MTALGLAAGVASEPDPLVGRWEDPRDGLRLAVEADGTYTVAPTDRAALTGTWSRDVADVVTFTNDADAAVCAGVPGRYEAIVSREQASFVVLEDACTPRMDHLEDTFVADDD